MPRSALAIMFAVVTLVTGAKPCLANPSVVVYAQPNETVEVSLPAWGSHVTVVTPTNSSSASPSIAHVELGLKAGYYKGGEEGSALLMPNLGLTLRISENWFMRGSAGVGKTSNGSMSDFGLGLGVWATDFLRLTFSTGQTVRRSNSWLWNQGGPIGKVTADYFVGANLFVSGEVFGGPSWDRNDQLSAAYGSALGLNWRF